jgi:seryl-tRNA synthetase
VKELPKDSTSLKAKSKADAPKDGGSAKSPKQGEVTERPKPKAEEQRS